MAYIEVKNLQKIYKIKYKEDGIKGAFKDLVNRKYKFVKAIKEVSFSIDEGEIVGYLGSNGSGKTTTLKILSGLLYPTSGEVLVDNYLPYERKKNFRKEISIVMGQKSQLWWDIPAIESFDLFAAMYELDDFFYKKRLKNLAELLEVSDKLNIPVRNLSLGERMKMELIGSLLHQPKLLLLDEPTIGLDIIAQQNIREFIKKINLEYKTTILITSHYMKDIEEICDRVIVLDSGYKIFDGKLNEIRKQSNEEKIITISFEKNIELDNFEKYGHVLEKKDNIIKLKVNNENMKSTMKTILNKYNVIDYSVEDVSIDDTMISLFRRER